VPGFQRKVRQLRGCRADNVVEISTGGFLMASINFQRLVDSSLPVRRAAGFYFDAIPGGISKKEAVRFADTFKNAAALPPDEWAALLSIGSKLAGRARDSGATEVLSAWRAEVRAPKYHEHAGKLLEYLRRRPEIGNRIKAAHYAHVPLDQIEITKAELLESVRRPDGRFSNRFRVWVKPAGLPDTVVRLLVTPTKGGKAEFQLK
jgi:hypothetical protein